MGPDCQPPTVCKHGSLTTKYAFGGSPMYTKCNQCGEYIKITEREERQDEIKHTEIDNAKMAEINKHLIITGGLFFGWAISWLFFCRALSREDGWVARFYGLNMAEILPFLLVGGWALLWVGICLDCGAKR